jgi:chemotaxis protein methyltransferase CheR
MAILTTQDKASQAAIAPDDYKFLQDYVYRESGIVLDGDKQYLLDARLTPVARRHGMGNIQDLCNLLRGVQGVRAVPGAAAPGAVRQQVVEAMTTNETLFFRELAQYDALRTRVLPELMRDRAASRRLSFWSAAASSGQEAYSLAMMLREMSAARDFAVQILGTDLNESILDRARQGRYLQIEVNRGLPIAYLLKYFTRSGLEWQIKDDIRQMVRFQQFDLRQSMRTKGPFDIIFCRNVLIYFDQATKRRILSELRGALNKGGYLLLGGSETTLGVDEHFKRVEVGQAALYQA